MPERHNLYELGPGASRQAAVLIHHLDGALDSGHAGGLAVRQLLSSMEPVRVATFSPDALIDYRARRPVIEMSQWVLSQPFDPYIALDVVEDYQGRSVFILHGAEPDMRWQEFAATIAELMRERGVTMAASLMGFAATLPHTRPTFVHRTGTSATLIPPQPDQNGRVGMHASMDLYLESYLGRVGFDAVGAVVAVPYYLSETEYPAGAVALLDHVGEFAGLSLPLGDLEAYATSLRKRVDQAVEESSEIAEIVAQLEQDYDADTWHSQPGGNVGALPSGEALAQSLEDFLQHNDRQRARRVSQQTSRATSLTQRLRRRGRHLASDLPRPGDGDPQARSPRGRHRKTTED